MDELLLMAGLVFAIALLTGMNRLSGQLGEGVPVSTKAWLVSDWQQAAGRYLLIAGSLLAVPALLITFSLEALYPIGTFTNLTNWLAVLLVAGGFLLVVAAILIPITLIWRSVQRFGVRHLIRILQQVIQQKLLDQPARVTFLQLGKRCFMIGAVMLQLMAGACWWLLQGTRNDAADDEENDVGDFYNFRTRRFDHGQDPGGMYLEYDE